MTVTADVGARASTMPRDRFFVVAGVCMLLITVAGFAPTFFLAPLYPGPELPLYLVLHGLSATAWVVAFVAQTALIHTSNIALHRKTGRVVAAVAVAMVASGLYVLYSLVHASDDITADLPRIAPGFWGNLAILGSFSAFVALGYRFRRRPQVHKRLMLLATLSIMGQPLVRIGWMEWLRLSDNRGINDTIYGLGGLAVLWVIVMLYEAWTRGRPHLVTVIGGALFLAAVVVMGLLVPRSRLGTSLILWLA